MGEEIHYYLWCDSVNVKMNMPELSEGWPGGAPREDLVGTLSLRKALLVFACLSGNLEKCPRHCFHRQQTGTCGTQRESWVAGICVTVNVRVTRTAGMQREKARRHLCHRDGFALSLMPGYCLLEWPPASTPFSSAFSLPRPNTG